MSMLDFEDTKLRIFKIIQQSFFIYYIFSAILLYSYTTQRTNFEENYGINIAIISAGIIFCIIIPLIKVLYDFLKNHYQIQQIFYSFIINIIFSGFVILELIYILSYHQYYWINGINGAILAWYIAVGFVVVCYINRSTIKALVLKIHKKIIGSKDIFPAIKKISYKMTLIPYFLDWFTIRNLNNNYRAVYFSKKFIIIQAKQIKTTLPGLMPGNVYVTMKNIFQDDIERMQQLFLYNHIKTYSKIAILKFVMKIADPIIKDLQLTLEQYLTEELLKENNDIKNLTINIDNLWNRVEKIMTNWESTFTENDHEYIEKLLQK